MPTAGFSGSRVTVFPLTLLVASASLDWSDSIGEREQALRTADEMIARSLTSRNPEVDWVLPAELRRGASRAPGMLANPDRLGTPVLRSPAVDQLPDPLFSQMRALVGVVGSRFALVPASLFFVPPEGDTLGRGGVAELTLVLVDVRTGLIRWRNVSVGQGASPWDALESALRSLNPDLP